VPTIVLKIDSESMSSISGS